MVLQEENGKMETQTPVEMQYGDAACEALKPLEIHSQFNTIVNNRVHQIQCAW